MSRKFFFIHSQVPERHFSFFSFRSSIPFPSFYNHVFHSCYLKANVSTTSNPTHRPTLPSIPSAPTYRCITISSNPCHPTQLVMTLPDPTPSPRTPPSSFIQLFPPAIQPTLLFQRLEEAFPQCTFRYSIGFSPHPYTFPASLADCLRSNLVVWIQETPYLVTTTTGELSLHPPVPELTKLQQYHVIDQWVSKKMKVYLYAGASWLVTQLSTMIYLTYELGWDVMEPVSYLVGLGTTILGATYYAFFRAEYTYEDIFQRIESKMRESLSSRRNMDA